MESRDWLLGARGAELEPWADAAANLPQADEAVAAVLCVPKSAPTIWVRDEAIDDPDLWVALQRTVQRYDAGDRDGDTWAPVLDGGAHLALFAAPTD
jgi:hypothetical protein